MVTISYEKQKVFSDDNVGANEVFEYIKTNQPVKANTIAHNFPNVTQRTIERYLKQLKDEAKIEFKGSPKTGGYVVMERWATRKNGRQ